MHLIMVQVAQSCDIVALEMMPFFTNTITNMCEMNNFNVIKCSAICTNFITSFEK